MIYKNKIKQVKTQIKLWKRREKIYKCKTEKVTNIGENKLQSEGMTENDIRGQISSERKIKAKKYQARQMVHEYERELQNLEHKRVRYKTEYKRRLMIIKTQESDFRNLYQYQYDKFTKQPKMRRSVNRK